MNRKRIIMLQEILQKEDIDGALYGISGNMAYLLDDPAFKFQRIPETGGMEPRESGFFNNRTDGVLYVPALGEPLLVATHSRAQSFINTEIEKVFCFYDRLHRYLHDHLKGRKIALGLAFRTHLLEMVSEIDSSIETTDGEAFLEKMRAVKDADEIGRLRDLAKLTDHAMGEVVKQISGGMSQYEIGDLIASIGLKNGAEELSFFPNALYTQTGHSTSKTRGGFNKTWPLEKNTAIAFDFGYVMNGYCSDFGRSFYFGKASDHIKDAYAALQSAQMKVIDTIKPGHAISSYLPILLDELGQHGFAENLFRHNDKVTMGHQIGINVHEQPWINKDETEPLKAGMVMCLEPKIWLPGECYVRVEDMVLITENGAESLTKYSRTEFEI
jgi:Xaa-Pro aminopeptidase